MIHLFSPLTLRGVTLRNRIGLSPMCMYSCDAQDGKAHSFHIQHLGSRAAGGCGLVMTEATAILPEGRISPQDLGIWSDDHIPGLTQVTNAIHQAGAVSAIQLAHAGRKAGTYRPWSPVRGYIPLEEYPSARNAPSPIPFKADTPVPHELTLTEIEGVKQAFVDATHRALESGFDVVELHSAHGYLLHQFLSPLSNRRTDQYGGSFENRTRLHHELVKDVRKVWPESKPLFMRISGTDWVQGGWTLEDSVRLTKDLAPLGVDLIDCSSGGTVADAQIPIGPGYQVFIAEAVKSQTDCLSGAVGAITEPDQANQIILAGQADMVFLGREMLRNPYWPIQAAKALGETPTWPDQYGWAVG
ncbi:MAG: NADH:flavin oxidoreductase/NADH oxidase [Fimbriimonadaceae bacterium]|nr:MAG: NADH:flavin oxidoreductase/NADH oxidase [Fimbriimonadaceae bacterium]